MPYLSSTARASAKVEASGTVGPEAMTAGSSPGTSEITRVTSRAGWAAAASRPPLMADRCLRTVFISPIGAPERSRARVDRLLVRQREARGGQAEQGRSAARDQRQHEVVRPQSPHHLQHAAGGAVAVLVGNRMRRLDDLDPLAGDGVAVARDDQPGQRAGPVGLDRLRHGGGRLARADDDGAPLGRRRQVGRDAELGRGGAHGRVEHGPEQSAWLSEHARFLRTPRRGATASSLRDCRLGTAPGRLLGRSGSPPGGRRRCAP